MALINTSGETHSDDMTGEVLEHHQLLVGGKWRKPHSSSLIQVFSANTEFLIGSVPDADPVDVDSAVQAAGQARPLRLTHDHHEPWPYRFGGAPLTSARRAPTAPHA